LNRNSPEQLGLQAWASGAQHILSFKNSYLLLFWQLHVNGLFNTICI
jgi:hypothetical protein